MALLKHGIIIFLLGVLLGCGTTTPQNPVPGGTQRVIDRANKLGFEHQHYFTKDFVLTGYGRVARLRPPSSAFAALRRDYGVTSPGDVDALMRVYIEGDGNSWKTKYILSDNPTPRQPLALKLAMKDPHPNVIYLARPCQYTPMSMNKNCEGKYWSSHRYATQVIDSFNEALDQIKTKTGVREFVLIGFSGGASVATLLAQKRNDVKGLITVAGDLNHVKLNQHHQTTPLSGSLNPYDKANVVKDLPQHHWAGSKDKVVPTWLSKDFVKKVNSPCAKAFVLKGATHHKGWEEEWAGIVSQDLTCHS